MQQRTLLFLTLFQVRVPDEEIVIVIHCRKQVANATFKMGYLLLYAQAYALIIEIQMLPIAATTSLRGRT